MESSPSTPDLELQHEHRFQQRDWTARRVSAVVFAVVLICAGLGLFGGGPLSHASAESAGLRVEYERFARHGRASAMTVRLDRAWHEQMTISFEGGYFADATIESIFPRPILTTDSGDVQRFTFAASAGEPVVVRFSYLPPSAGSHGGRVRVGDASVGVSTFVYP